MGRESAGEGGSLVPDEFPEKLQRGSGELRRIELGLIQVRESRHLQTQVVRFEIVVRFFEVHCLPGEEGALDRVVPGLLLLRQFEIEFPGGAHPDFFLFHGVCLVEVRNRGYCAL